MTSSESLGDGARLGYRLTHRQFSIAAIMSVKKQAESNSGKIIFKLSNAFSLS